MKQYSTLTGEDEMSLNSSLQTLGQLMATNLQSKGVTANASDGLTTLANKILQVGPTPIGYNLELTSDKNILSFYDDEHCVLTATLLDSNGNGVSGEEIVFKANGGLLGTVITGDNGVAQCTYQSTGVGDVTITAECMNFVQTFVVEDCTYYDTVTYTSDTTKNISVPSNFKLEFDLYPKSRSTSSGGVSHYVKLTRPSTTDMWFGQGTSSGNHGIMVRPSTNYWCSSLTTLNTDNHVVVTYDGSNVLYTCNGESKSVSYSNGFGVISGISSTSNGNLKNIKIKPLQ